MLRFAFGLSLSLLRLAAVFVILFLLLFFLFPWGSEIKLVFPSECLSMLLQVRHDGIVGVEDTIDLFDPDTSESD
jgi:hypothetical protein